MTADDGPVGALKLCAIPSVLSSQVNAIVGLPALTPGREIRVACEESGEGPGNRALRTYDRLSVG